jgi:DNA-binding transcriptional ArsR family regulator
MVPRTTARITPARRSRVHGRHICINLSSSMNDGVAMIDRRSAEAYASWFRCLADATRIQILHLLAEAGGPLTVKEIVTAVGVGQSTVSAHLRRLADLEFVFVEHAGTASFYRVNAECLTAFPAAADVVMGRLPRATADDPLAAAPWSA